MKKSLLLCALAGICLAGCDPDAPATAIQISPEALSDFDSNGGSQLFHLFSQYSWNASASEPWCVVTPAKGSAGPFIVKVAVEENIFNEARSAVVTLVNAAGVSVAIAVEQLPVPVGVVINGVTWATCNVDAPGTFAAAPHHTGMFYQWNRSTAWPATGDITGWDSSNASGTEWEEDNDPCPEGWRLPTSAELNSLTNAATDYPWKQGDVWGGRFSDKADASKFIFLPAAGMRLRGTIPDVGYAGEAVGAGELGDYWSRTEYTSPNAVHFWFDHENKHLVNAPRGTGQSVRCVKK